MTAAALLAAMLLGIAHSPAPSTGCGYVVPVLAADQSRIMAGNMRTTDGGCVIWFNLGYADALGPADVCTLAAHEAGHLAGLPHSPDPTDVMHSPYTAGSIPYGCKPAPKPRRASTRLRRRHRHRRN